MSLRLLNTKTLPKDGFLYIDPNSGRKFGGMFSFKYVVNEVLAYRKGNNLPRATMEEVAEDVDSFTCNRNPSLCYDSNVRVYEQVRQTRGCGSCGIKTL